MSEVNGCKAYCRGQQYFCDRCGCAWDIDDIKPDCKTGRSLFIEEREKLRLAQCEKENTTVKVNEPQRTTSEKYHQAVINTLKRGG